jgi:hypothetical protein
MSAIFAGRARASFFGDSASDFKIFLLDSRPKIGAKILMSGGTRCNVTHVKVLPADYHGAAPHFVKHVLEAFTPDETIRFFEEIGVPLALESTGKYFPMTHSGKTVLERLIKEVGRLGIEIRTGGKVTDIVKTDDGFILSVLSGNTPSFITARRVILATGGLSYPETGSDGTGIRVAEKMGHRIIKTSPALSPLMTEDKEWPLLSGVSLQTTLSFFKNGRKAAESRGPFLFTHFGFSGPAALDISRFVARSGKEDSPEIYANFLPEETREVFKKRFDTARTFTPSKPIRNFLIQDCRLPDRFVGVLLNKINIKTSLSFAHCSASLYTALFESLFRLRLPVSGVFGYRKAEVTAGGIDLKDVKVSTLESKKVPGLYFTGEMLDIDGRIGGFNFQWAWSTGAVAGQSAVRGLLSC